MRRLVDLSQPIRFGQVTHPGLPAPAWEAWLSPFHRFADAADLAALPLHTVVDLPIRTVDLGDAGFGTPAYAHEAPYLTADGVVWLADRDPALVGIGAVNIDDLDDPARPEGHGCTPHRPRGTVSAPGRCGPTPSSRRT